MTDLHTARRQLIALRNKHGAASPIGSRCSLAVELLQNIDKKAVPDRSHLLRGSLKATLTEITMLQAGAPADAQVRREAA